ncbi:MAG TPA: carboxylesterase family protein, partial [Thermoguttaceae bacterium]|nr:carboxylesterase family protein [Thermoguttaceae bacterium]
MPSRLLSLVVALILAQWAIAAGAQTKKEAKAAVSPAMGDAKVEVYKRIGDVALNIYIYTPKDHKPSDNRPAIVFFFGGGWVGGTPSQFRPHAEYLASRGMVAMAADYRVSSRHKTSPFECVEDG